MGRSLQVLANMSLPENPALLRAYQRQTECEITHIVSQIICTIMTLLPADKLNWLDLYEVPHARDLLLSLDFWEHTIREAMANKLASLTATATVIDTSARIVQILLEKTVTQEHIFHAVRVWVPHPLLIYLRRRLEDLHIAKPVSTLGALELPWDIGVINPRNIAIRMPNRLCTQLQSDFLQIIRTRFLRIKTNDQFEKLFPRQIELHFQLAFHHLGCPNMQRPYFGGLHAFLRNNFPTQLPMEELPPLRILARNPPAVEAYIKQLNEFQRTVPSDRKEIANFAAEHGVLFTNENSARLSLVLKALKKRSHSSSDQQSDRSTPWPPQSDWQPSWHSSSSWQNTSWHHH